MTCIVALKGKKSIIIGGDSAACLQDEIAVMASPKIFRKNELVIGYSGSFRVGQLLEHKFRPSKCVIETQKYMKTVFISEYQKCLKENNAIKSDSTTTEDAELIVVINDELFTISTDYSVLQSVNNFATIGAGNHYALGSLYSTKGRTKARVTKALETAAFFSPWVRPPFTLIEVNYGM